jgi:hypothetical protein
MRSLIVSGISPRTWDMPTRLRPSLAACSSKAEPAPLFTMRSMGQPPMTGSERRTACSEADPSYS